MLDFHLARFDLQVSPPVGHPLCGGWIKPAEVTDDPLLLRGVVVLGALGAEHSMRKLATTATLNAQVGRELGKPSQTVHVSEDSDLALPARLWAQVSR